MSENEKKKRTYTRSESIVFCKTKESFGGLSNMAGGYPLLVNGIHIRTTEALYQACRYPALPDVQQIIIEQKSPMTAKMKSKPYRHLTRADWNVVRVNIMRWCLRVKLAQNWHKFGFLLGETGNSPIVEESKKDDFWGAKATNDNVLVGYNVLGRLLMELRDEYRAMLLEKSFVVRPLEICDFTLLGQNIEEIKSQFEVNVEKIGNLKSEQLSIYDIYDI